MPFITKPDDSITVVLEEKVDSLTAKLEAQTKEVTSALSTMKNFLLKYNSEEDDVQRLDDVRIRNVCCVIMLTIGGE